MSLLLTSLRTAVVITSAVLLFSSLTPVIAADSATKEHLVEIKNLKFTPSELTVAPGDRIIWVNKDFVPHTVTAVDESWDSSLIEADGKWQMVVTADMDESYFCRFHPNMKAAFSVVQQ